MDEKYLSQQLFVLTVALATKSTNEDGKNKRTEACRNLMRDFYHKAEDNKQYPYDILKKTLAGIYVEMLRDYCYLGDNPEIDTILDQVELIEDYLAEHLPYLYQD